MKQNRNTEVEDLHISPAFANEMLQAGWEMLKFGYF